MSIILHYFHILYNYINNNMLYKNFIKSYPIEKLEENILIS